MVTGVDPTCRLRVPVANEAEELPRALLYAEEVVASWLTTITWDPATAEVWAVAVKISACDEAAVMPLSAPVKSLRLLTLSFKSLRLTLNLFRTADSEVICDCWACISFSGPRSESRI